MSIILWFLIVNFDLVSKTPTPLVAVYMGKLWDGVGTGQGKVREIQGQGKVREF